MPIVPFFPSNSLTRARSRPLCGNGRATNALFVLLCFPHIHAIQKYNCLRYNRPLREAFNGILLIRKVKVPNDKGKSHNKTFLELVLEMGNRTAVIRELPSDSAGLPLNWVVKLGEFIAPGSLVRGYIGNSNGNLICKPCIWLYEMPQEFPL